MPDNVHCALLLSLLATILSSSEVGHEQLFIYRSFEEGVNFMPQVFPITFEVLTKKMEQVLSSAQNLEIMTAVLSIMDSIYQQKLDSTNAVPDDVLKKYLSSVGFQGLPEVDHFQSSFRTSSLSLVSAVIETVLA